jgi:hypothetical protein
MDGYVDEYNSGCEFAADEPTLQPLTAAADGAVSLDGRSGWYTTANVDYRDMDWFLVRLDPAGDGVLTATLTAQESTYLFEAGPHDCAEVEALQYELSTDCAAVTLTVAGEPGDAVWLVVAPDTFSAPGWIDHEYSYLLELDGIAASIVRNEVGSWSSVKALFRRDSR